MRYFEGEWCNGCFGKLVAIGTTAEACGFE